MTAHRGAHDCDALGCEGVERRTHLECIAQGKPIGIDDSEALATTAAIFNNPAGAPAPELAKPRRSRKAG